jgi:ParB family chromosome partitioning protein
MLMAETGKFEIPAGGRRFQALSSLVKQKRLEPTTSIPCIVRNAGSAILAKDDSLAENTSGCRALHDKGQSDAEIAAGFFVTPQIVKQRLKLASVATALLEVYAEDGMTLDQLMPGCSPSIGRWKTDTRVRMNCLTKSTRDLASWKRRCKRSKPDR